MTAQTFSPRVTLPLDADAKEDLYLASDRTREHSLTLARLGARPCLIALLTGITPRQARHAVAIVDPFSKRGPGRRFSAVRKYAGSRAIRQQLSYLLGALQLLQNDGYAQIDAYIAAYTGYLADFKEPLVEFDVFQETHTNLSGTGVSDRDSLELWPCYQCGCVNLKSLQFGMTCSFCKPGPAPKLPRVVVNPPLRAQFRHSELDTSDVKSTDDIQTTSSSASAHRRIQPHPTAIEPRKRSDAVALLS